MENRTLSFTLWLAAVASLLMVACASTPGKDRPRLRETVSYDHSMADSMVEGKRSMKGTMWIQRYPSDRVFDIKRDIVSLQVAGPRGQRLSVAWPEELPSDVTVDPQKKYQVDLLTRIYKGPDYVFNDLLRISDGQGRVIVDASICNIHKLPMQRQLENGKSAEAYSRSFMLKREKEFPNDGNVYLACGSGIHHTIWCCPACEKGYHRYTSRHGINESW